MCQQCVDAVKTIWPELAWPEQYDLLIGATAFPFSGPNETAKQLRDIHKRSGGDFNTAMSIVDAEWNQAMIESDAKKAKEPTQ